MDRFIANCSTRTLEVEGPLKSNMDRFIDITLFWMWAGAEPLKSNMDRFIVNV